MPYNNGTKGIKGRRKNEHEPMLMVRRRRAVERLRQAEGLGLRVQPMRADVPGGGPGEDGEALGGMQGQGTEP